MRTTRYKTRFAGRPEPRHGRCVHCGYAPHRKAAKRRRDEFYEVFRGGDWVREEVAIVEAEIGRPIPAGARVLHINGVHNDNRPENLFLELSDEPSLTARLTWECRRCARCDGDFFVDPRQDRRLKLRTLFCCRECYAKGRPRKQAPRTKEREWPARPDPDRWRSWTPGLAWACRLVPDPDPGPGGPQRYPVIEVSDPPDDLPYFGRG